MQKLLEKYFENYKIATWSHTFPQNRKKYYFAKIVYNCVLLYEIDC